MNAKVARPMRGLIVGTLVALASMACTHRTLAQIPSPTGVGSNDSVRVRHRKGSEEVSVEGALVTLRPDAVLIRGAGTVSVLPRELITRIERYAPQSAGQRAVKGMGWGLLAGALLGGALGLSSTSEWQRSMDGGKTWETHTKRSVKLALVAAFGLGSVGAVGGGILCASLCGDQWEEISLDDSRK